jgi:hypothetical protein
VVALLKTGLVIASMGTLRFVTPDAIPRKRRLNIRLSALAPPRSNGYRRDSSMPPFGRLSYSLRQGLILMTLICVACATVNSYIDYRERQRAAEFVNRALKSRHYASTKTITTESTIGREARSLVRYDDRPRLVAELVRLLNDPKWQSDNRSEAVRALGMLTEMPGVVESMLALLDLQHLGTTELTVISELRHVKRYHMLVIARLLEMTRSDRDRVRQNAYCSLEAIAYRHREFADAISAVLIGALDDSSELIRSRAAGTLGGLPHPDLADALADALDDESDLVRLGAARSLRKVTGDEDLLVRIAGEVLLDDEAAFEAKQQAIGALRDIDEIPTETVDALRDYAVAATDSVPFSQRSSMQFHLGVAARRLLWQKGIEKNVGVGAQGK